LVGGKVSDEALQAASATVSASWSVPGDLVDAILELSHEGSLIGAEKDGVIDDVEDQLFRFGRILDANGDLEQALGQRSVPVENRLALLDGLIGDRVQPVTRSLLDGVLRIPRSSSMYASVDQLVDLAARRRSRSVAIVTAPVPLTAEQEQRLANTLARIYGRQIAISVDVDRSVLGGLHIKVGDDEIDGTMAGRLEQASRRFAS
jgi:F-type H+-transporting ATPase subunit delta